jgi:ABC-type multidrug transport system ATPase subunit
LLDRGVVVVLSSHLFDEIQGRVDRVALISDGVIGRQGRIDELLADLGVRSKSVRLKFEKALTESDLAALRAIAPGLQRSGEDSLTAELDGQAVAGVLSVANSRNLGLRDIRIDGNELAYLMETSR